MEGVESRRDAIGVLQHLLDDNLVVHASGDRHVPFIDGFFLYQALDKESGSEGKGVESIYIVCE